MLINSPDKFAFVISTRNRPAFVRRTIEFLRRQQYAGSLLVVDASDDPLHGENALILAAVPQMDISHFRPPWRGNNWIETADGCESIPAKYVLWHHDDDFYFLEPIERAIAILEADRAAACAQGREVFLSARIEGGRLGLNLGTSPRFAYHGASPTDRLTEIFRGYCHLFFSVMRREVFIDACRRTARHLEQGWFDQYAWTALAAAQGKAILTDELCGVRQKHTMNHSRVIRPYDHWPLLVANPGFSQIFGTFKACLLEAYGLSNSEMLRPLIDQGLVSLIERQYGLGHAPDVVDRRIVDLCRQPGAPEQARIAMIAEAIAQHPQTV